MSKTENAVVDTAEVEEIVQDNVVAPSLTIQDLGNLRSMLDVAAKRGVFKTEEFALVGETFMKLSNFIAAITPQGAKDADDPANK